jgi:hypothetical protein
LFVCSSLPQDNILKSYPPSSVAIEIGNAALAIIISLSYPLLAFPARFSQTILVSFLFSPDLLFKFCIHSLNDVVQQRVAMDQTFFSVQPPPRKRMIGEALIFVVLSCLTAILVPGEQIASTSFVQV